MIGTLMAFWLIIVPLPNPSAQDWRLLVSDVAGWFFPMFWTDVLYFVAALSAAVFLPRTAIEGKASTVILIVYLVYAQVGFWSLSWMRNVNPDGASIMAFCLVDPLIYPIAISISLLAVMLILFVRQIKPWNKNEWKRMLFALPLLSILLATPLLLAEGTIEKSFSEIWLKIDGAER
ncbi:unnamed protein product [Sphagnum balticum]